ncbi:MAG: nickel pincer cofactor biosynthesis protein LarC [Candidatus Nanopelagicales bacterium]
MTWWVDAGAGASGDMVLGALLALDPSGLAAAQDAVDQVLDRLGAPGSVELGLGSTHRAGMAATQALVRCSGATTRTWRDIEPALAGLDAAREVFASLADAEATAHGIPPESVHFHEVGALDAIADIVAATVLWDRLGPARVVISPVCVGSGTVAAAHGRITVPGPAVTALLMGAPTFAGMTPHEACTPTGAALLRFMATEWGPQPAMKVRQVAVGAGGRDVPEQPNVLRILAGSDETDGLTEHLVLVETTIDDLDPRIHPDVLDSAKAAGALETWLTPVIMKHGRPAVVVTALTAPDRADAVAGILFRQTTTLGVRYTRVERRALRRDFVAVTVRGHQLQVKRGWLDGAAVTWTPEYRDVQRVAQATGLPVLQILREAQAEADSRGH